MRSVFPFLLLLALLPGCAATSISSVKVDKPKEYYIGMLSLVLNMDANFSRLDSVTYEQHIRGNFNNLEDSKKRTHLESSLQAKLEEQAQTRIVTSSEMFGVNKDVPFHQFLKEIKASGVDGILIINMRDYWISQNSAIYDDETGITTVDVQPNAKFYTYLVDADTYDTVWFADSIVSGRHFAGYDTLNNHLVRALFQNLRKDGYILTKATVGR